MNIRGSLISIVRRRVTLLPTAMAALALTAPLAAQRPVQPLVTSTFTLANGLQFVVHEDHSTPIVAVIASYRVGGAHDPPGRRGFAHLFEHLMFQETEHLKRGQIGQLILGAGGYYNGATSGDGTLYVEVLPSNSLNLALWIEAERMSRLKVTEENFRREREVVKEEARTRRENQPYGATGGTLDTLAMDYPPYDRAGSTRDLDASALAGVRDFYKTYYNPNSATIIVAGDVTEFEVRELANRYFAGIPRGPAIPPLPPPTPTPRTTGERRATITDRLAAMPRLDVAWNIPSRRHEDSYALSLLSSILGAGESSRLYRRLVREEQVAPAVNVIFDGRYGPGLFKFRASPNQGVPIQRLEAILEDEIGKLKAAGVTPRELEKAKNQHRADQIIRLRQDVFYKAVALQDAHLMHGDADALNASLDKSLAVTIDDIVRVARTYLVAPNRSVVTTLPANPAAGKE